MPMIRKPYTSDEPRVSVVVPTLPGNDHDAVVAALRNQTVTDFEVLLVDDASLDICEARNAGIEAATADVVALTDDDCLPPPDWVETVENALADDAVCVEGRVSGGRVYRGDGPVRRVQSRLRPGDGTPRGRIPERVRGVARRHGVRMADGGLRVVSVRPGVGDVTSRPPACRHRHRERGAPETRVSAAIRGANRSRDGAWQGQRLAVAAGGLERG